MGHPAPRLGPELSLSQIALLVCECSETSHEYYCGARQRCENDQQANNAAPQRHVPRRGCSCVHSQLAPHEAVEEEDGDEDQAAKVHELRSWSCCDHFRLRCLLFLWGRVPHVFAIAKRGIRDLVRILTRFSRPAHIVKMLFGGMDLSACPGSFDSGIRPRSG